MTDSEKLKAAELIASVEIAIGEISPRDGGNAALIKGMLQSMNGLREVLGLGRPPH